MNRHLVIVTVLLLSMTAISTSAQTQPATPAATPRPAAPQATPIATPIASVAVPATKIAFVDTSVFGDEKLGITRFVTGVKNLEREFQTRQNDLTNLQSRIKAINDEITKLRGNAVVSPQTIQAKEAEAQDLQRALKYKKDQADADFGKRYPQAIGPISAAIGKALDEYANQHGLTLVLDISKILPAILTINPATDITQAFIADYNSKNP